MKNINLNKWLMCFIVLCTVSLVSNQVNGQLYCESFNEDGVGVAGVCADATIGSCATNVAPSNGQWSLTGDFSGLAATSDFLQVSGGQLVAQDLDAEICFETSAIALNPGLSNDATPCGEFGLSISETGSHEATDYVNVEYSLDGGAFTPVTGSPFTDDFTSATVLETGITGTTINSSIVIRICMLNNAGTEQFMIDDIFVRPCNSSVTCPSSCDLVLTPQAPVCDAETAGTDTYDITIDFTSGAIGTMTVMNGVGTLAGADPINTGAGSIMIQDIPEGTDVDYVVYDSQSGCCYAVNTASPACLASCAITNVTVTADGACSGDDATYTVCADVAGGSGDYDLVDTDNANAILSSLTGQADGNICFNVTLTGPTSASTINVDVVDNTDSACISGTPATVTIPVCPIVVANCDLDAASDIIITEIMYNPCGSDNDGEFVEICNTGATAIDISGWMIFENADPMDGTGGSANDIVPMGTTLAPGACYATAAATFMSNLNNTGDVVSVQNCNGDVIDFVAYDESIACADSDNGISISLVDWMNQDATTNDNMGNWAPSADAGAGYGNGGTPGAPNTYGACMMISTNVTVVCNGPDAEFTIEVTYTDANNAPIVPLVLEATDAGTVIGSTTISTAAGTAMIPITITGPTTASTLDIVIAPQGATIDQACIDTEISVNIPECMDTTPELTATKAANDGTDLQYVLPNGDAQFAITLENTGATNICNIVISDPNGADCVLAAADIDALVAATGDGDMDFEPGESITYTCMVTGVTADFTNEISIDYESCDDPGTVLNTTDTTDVEVLCLIENVAVTQVCTGTDDMYTIDICFDSYETGASGMFNVYVDAPQTNNPTTVIGTYAYTALAGGCFSVPAADFTGDAADTEAGIQICVGDADAPTPGAGLPSGSVPPPAMASGLPDVACPTVLGIMINGCGQEANNEFVVVKNGDNDLDLSTATLDFDTPSGNDLDTWASAATVSGLITTAGWLGNCFVAADATTVIPAEATIIVMGGTNMDVAYDFTSLCASEGTIYVLVDDNATTGNNGGHFSNSDGRTMVFSVTGTAGCDATESYTYLTSDVANMDGDYASFSMPDSPTQTAGNNGDPAVNTATITNGGCTGPEVVPAAVEVECYGCTTLNEVLCTDCNISVATATASACDNAATLPNDMDDTFTFTLDVTQDDATLTNYTFDGTALGLSAAEAGTYGVAGYTSGNITIGALAGTTITLTIVDDVDPTCTATVDVIVPATCSVCPDITVVANPVCSAEGTMFDIEYTITGGTGPYTITEAGLGALTAQAAMGTLMGLTYTDQNTKVTLTIEDEGNPGCSVMYEVLQLNCEAQMSDCTCPAATYDVNAQATGNGNGFSMVYVLTDASGAIIGTSNNTGMFAALTGDGSTYTSYAFNVADDELAAFTADLDALTSIVTGDAILDDGTTAPFDVYCYVSAPTTWTQTCMCEECPPTQMVAGAAANVCTLGTEVADWQAEVELTDGTGAVVSTAVAPATTTIVYSATAGYTVTDFPSSGWDAVPSGAHSGTGCAIEDQTWNAYVICDLTGDGETADDVVTAVGSITISFYPPAQAPMITIDDAVCNYTITPACPNDMLTPASFGPETPGNDPAAIMVTVVTEAGAGCTDMFSVDPPECPAVSVCTAMAPTLTATSPTCTDGALTGAYTFMSDGMENTAAPYITEYIVTDGTAGDIIGVFGTLAAAEAQALLTVADSAGACIQAINHDSMSFTDVVNDLDSQVFGGGVLCGVIGGCPVSTLEELYTGIQGVGASLTVADVIALIGAPNAGNPGFDIGALLGLGTLLVDVAPFCYDLGAEECIAPVPCIMVDKNDADDSDDTQEATMAGDATFTITITNTGNEDLCGITLVDMASDAALTVTACEPTFASIDTDNGGVVAGMGNDILAVGDTETYVCTVSGVTASFTNTIMVNAAGCSTMTTVTDDDPTEVTVPTAECAITNVVATPVCTDNGEEYEVCVSFDYVNEGADDTFDVVIGGTTVGSYTYTAYEAAIMGGATCFTIPLADFTGDATDLEMGVTVDIVDTDASGAASALYISAIYPNQTGGGDQNGDATEDFCDEYIVITNGSSAAIDLSGYAIGDAANNARHIFPSGTMLAAGASLTIYNADLSTMPSCGSGVWNNGSETATLYDAMSNIVDEIMYSSTTGGMEISFVPTCQGSAMYNEASCISCLIPTTVMDMPDIVCTGGGTPNLTAWQLDITNANTTDAITSIQYSSVVVDGVAVTTPDGNLPTGDHSVSPGCTSEDQIAYAYFVCDPDGVADNGDETITLISTYTLTVYPIPDVTNATGGACTDAVTDNCGGLDIQYTMDGVMFSAVPPILNPGDADVMVIWTATITGAPTGCEATGNFMLSCPQLNMPAIMVDKNDADDSDDTQEATAAGDATFTITITNTGNEDLCNITLVDTPSDATLTVTTCEPTFASVDTDNGGVAAGAGDGILAVGETETYMCTVSGVTTDFMNQIAVSAEGCTSMMTVGDTDTTFVTVPVAECAITNVVATPVCTNNGEEYEVCVSFDYMNEGADDTFDVVIGGTTVGSYTYTAYEAAIMGGATCFTIPLADFAGDATDLEMGVVVDIVDTDASGAASDLYISAIYPNQTGGGDQNGDAVEDFCDEYIVITNGSAVAIDLSGYAIGDVANNARHIFPSGTMLAAGASLTIYNADLSTMPSCGSGVWNNGSETATLYDAMSNIVDEIMYSTTTGGMEISFAPTCQGSAMYNEASCVTLVPAIMVDKNDADDSDDTQEATAAGDATFTITITNTGNEDLCNITLVDTPSDATLTVTTCEPTFASVDTDNGGVAVGAGDGILAVGETETYMCTVSGVTTDFMNQIAVSAEGCTSMTMVGDTDTTFVTVPAPVVCEGAFGFTDFSLCGTDAPTTITAPGGDEVTAGGDPIAYLVFYATMSGGATLADFNGATFAGDPLADPNSVTFNEFVGGPGTVGDLSYQVFGNTGCAPLSFSLAFVAGALTDTDADGVVDTWNALVDDMGVSCNQVIAYTEYPVLSVSVTDETAPTCEPVVQVLAADNSVCADETDIGDVTCGDSYDFNSLFPFLTSVGAGSGCDVDLSGTVTCDPMCDGSFDLALTKTFSTYIDNDMDGVISVGDDAVFTINVFNQGTIDAYDVAVTDYFTAGELIYVSSVLNAGSTGTVTDNGVNGFEIDLIPAGMSTAVDVTLTIDPTFAGTNIINNAEITFASESDNGPLAMDEDSTPNDDSGNPAETGTDDDISDDMNGGMDNPNDSDDYDPAALALGCPPCPNIIGLDRVCDGNMIYVVDGDTGAPVASATAVYTWSVLDENGVWQQVAVVTGQPYYSPQAAGTYSVQVSVGAGCPTCVAAGDFSFEIGKVINCQDCGNE